MDHFITLAKHLSRLPNDFSEVDAMTREEKDEAKEELIRIIEISAIYIGDDDSLLITYRNNLAYM